MSEVDDSLDDDDNGELYEDNGDEAHGGIMRWLPAVVVTGVVVGFVTLAWYAYNAGTQSMKEEDLLVVEADKTPVKEKPTDPGGMKFPDQDKTIFETFGNSQPQAKVERVLPAPEEPMPKQMDTADTTTWVNDKSKKGSEEIKPASPPTTPVAPVVAPAQQAAPTKNEAVPAKMADADNEVTSYTAKPTAPAPVVPAAAPAPEQPKPTAVKPAPKLAPAKAAPVKDVDSSVKVQLGAYRSSKEAQDAWSAMQKKFKALSDKTPLVVKADLGDKGIYYRLRVADFSDAADAKAFCKGLTNSGQACILP